MNLLESLKVAWGGLMGNKLRSALTMLGVIIGVAAVIALVSIGQGASKQITDRIQSLGSNVITISPRPNTPARFFLSEVKDLEKRVPTIARVVPSLSRSVTVKWGSQKYDTTMEGTGPAYTEIRNFPVATGRFIAQEDVDARRKVAVIGKKVNDQLFDGANPIGESVLINGETFTVVGTMSEKGQGMGGDFDDRVLVPITSAQRLARTNRIGSILAQVHNSDEAAPAVAHIQAIYQKKWPTRNPGKDDAVMVFSQDQLLSTVGDTAKTFTIMLGGIAGISLLVGGIGIMNIMLVSVTERTREIGIRKAIGAKRRDILSQFLVESLFLSVMGGAVGILAGVGGSSLIRLGDFKTSVSGTSVLMAFAFAAAVGIFFGIYPAMKASSLDPIEALRYE